MIEKYIKPKKEDNILDLGCGTGRLIDLLPEGIQYTGIDISTNYIEDAKRRYGNKYNFICSNIMDVDFSNFGIIDIVIASGFFHHLDDESIDRLLININSCMDDKTRLISVDPCIVDEQNWISKLLVKNDRGKYVRSKECYV